MSSRYNFIMRIAVVLVSLNIRTVLNINEESSCDSESARCGGISCKKFDVNSNSVITSASSGRLGNQMFTYKLLLSLKLQFGFQPFLVRKTYDRLIPFFHHLDMGMAEEELCDFEGVYSDLGNQIKEQRMQILLEEIENLLGHKVHLKRENGKWQIPEELAVIKGVPVEQIIHSSKFKELKNLRLEGSEYPWEIFRDRMVSDIQDEEFLKGRALILYPDGHLPLDEEMAFINQAPNFVEELEKAFRLKEEFVVEAEATLNKIVEDHVANRSKQKTKLKKKSKLKEFVFIGIHSRRTDHLSMEKETGHVQLKPSYYLQAMDLYREHFGRKRTPIFVYISDDMEWGIQNLEFRNKFKDLYFGGNSEFAYSTHSTGHDLALMSLCNHTIISYGTFSFWAGFLAGGNVISPFHFPEYWSRSKRIRDHPLQNPLPRFHPYF